MRYHSFILLCVILGITHKTSHNWAELSVLIHLNVRMKWRVTVSIRQTTVSPNPTKRLVSTHSSPFCPETAEDTCTHTHAAVKYPFKVLSLCHGAVITHITALHTQGPHCLDYRAETYNPVHSSLLSPVLSLWECVHSKQREIYDQCLYTPVWLCVFVVALWCVVERKWLHLLPQMLLR